MKTLMKKITMRMISTTTKKSSFFLLFFILEVLLLHAQQNPYVHEEYRKGDFENKLMVYRIAINSIKSNERYSDITSIPNLEKMIENHSLQVVPLHDIYVFFVSPSSPNKVKDRIINSIKLRDWVAYHINGWFFQNGISFSFSGDVAFNKNNAFSEYRLRNFYISR